VLLLLLPPLTILTAAAALLQNLRMTQIHSLPKMQ
jgi:hypothetical protein